MPTVLSPDEVASIFPNMEGEYWLITALLYGCGLRIDEALSLRIKNIDLKSRNLLVFNGKGLKDQYTLNPGNFRENLERQIAQARSMHEPDLADGFGPTSVPASMHKKYGPIVCRHDLHRSSYSRQMRQAVLVSGAATRVSAHTFKHAFVYL
ncbi:tyrosine-type recombinase/integrase [Marinobacter sp. F4216]|uniref:tyrosine-type recombinase/integrase n=1 Tax=Marinobacter sp. F4216 TaxID=2874281 RepID=UPI001CBF44C8|nr:tyrosine-type recombinase/integrase [Marinobacter sp. F4216]